MNFKILEIEPFDSNAFHIGEKFDSFEAITEKLNCYCKAAFVHYWTRDSRKIKESNSKSRHAKNSRLKYYSLRYTCVLGGQEHRSRGSGKRYSLSIRATNCPAFISFRLTKDGQSLEVSAVNNEHNHEQSEELFEALPKERKLPDEIKDDIMDLIKLQVDRDRVKQYVWCVAQKIISSKDLANIINGSRTQSRPEITPARSKELLAKLYHYEVKASTPDPLEPEDRLEPEPETCTSVFLVTHQARKRLLGPIPVGLIEKVSDPVTEISMNPPPTKKDKPKIDKPCKVPKEMKIKKKKKKSPAKRKNRKKCGDVIEDSVKYCVGCGQSIPENYIYTHG